MDKVVSSRTHTIRFESDELCVITYVGDVIAEDIHALHGEMKRWALRKPRFFILVDLSTIGGVGPAVRKAAAETLDAPNLRAMAIFGQSWAVRATAVLTVGLIRVLGIVKCPIQFFGPEQEARAWLGELVRT